MVGRMSRSALSYSVRKFLRREKARIRREISDTKEAEKKIQELVSHLSVAYNKRRPS